MKNPYSKIQIASNWWLVSITFPCSLLLPMKKSQSITKAPLSTSLRSGDFHTPTKQQSVIKLSSKKQERRTRKKNKEELYKNYVLITVVIEIVANNPLFSWQIGDIDRLSEPLSKGWNLLVTNQEISIAWHFQDFVWKYKITSVNTHFRLYQVFDRCYGVHQHSS